MNTVRRRIVTLESSEQCGAEDCRPPVSVVPVGRSVCPAASTQPIFSTAGVATSVAMGNSLRLNSRLWLIRGGELLVGMLMLAILTQVALGGQQTNEGPKRDEVEGRMEEWPACAAQGAEAFLVGDFDSALSVALTCLSNGRQDPVCAYTAACCYARAGELDLALDWLVRSSEWGGGGVALLSEDPALNALRGDPRFSELVKQAERREEKKTRDEWELDPRSFELIYDSVSAWTLAAHPLRPLLAVGWGDGCLDIVNLETGRRMKRLSKKWVPQSPVRFLEDGALVTSIVNGPSVVIWDVRSGEVVSVADLASRERGALVNLDIELRASKEGDALAILTRDGAVFLASDAGDWEVKETASYTWAFRDLAWGPNGRLYGVVKAGKLLSSSSVPGAEWADVTGHLTSIECRELAVSPSGSEVAVFGWSTSVGVAVVDVASGGRRLSEKTSFFGDVDQYFASYSPTGSRILLTGGSGRAWMMSAADLSELWSINYHSGTPFPIRCVFAQSGDSVLVARNTGGYGDVLAAEDGSAAGRFPCGPGGDFALLEGGVASIVLGNVFYTPLSGGGWTMLYRRTRKDSEIVVASDGRFAVSEWSVASQCQISRAGKQHRLADLANELLDPHGIRVLLNSLFMPQ